MIPGGQALAPTHLNHYTSLPTTNNEKLRRSSKRGRYRNLSDVTSSPPTVLVASVSKLKAGRLEREPC